MRYDISHDSKKNTEAMNKKLKTRKNVTKNSYFVRFLAHITKNKNLNFFN